MSDRADCVIESAQWKGNQSMVRAGVFIGVDRTGGLTPLKDAASGAERMYRWAIGQGMTDGSHAVLITDAKRAKVRGDLICDAIEKVLGGAGVDQLIVYFAGHGVIANRSEQWLLSDAPTRTSAAVDLVGSVELARRCIGAQHVIFISDACRVAAEGIQGQRVRGIDIFPNLDVQGPAHPVDQFFACAMGTTASETRDPANAAKAYSALYTSAFLDGLQGAFPPVLSPGTAAGDDHQYVMPYELGEYLIDEIPRRIESLQLEHEVNQIPEALVLSRNVWISRLKRAGLPHPDPPSPRLLHWGAGKPQSPVPGPGRVLRTTAQTMLHSAIAGDQPSLNLTLQQAHAGAPIVSALARSTEQLSQPFGPMHFETECGIKVRGARIAGFDAPNVKAELLGHDGQLLRVTHIDSPSSVLLQFDHGCATLIPVIPEFMAALTFDDDGRRLVDVAYEPSDNTWRWNRFRARAEEVRALRAVAASSTRLGRFRLDQANGIAVAQRMQYAKGIDPTLAIYAGYAYHDLQELERIRDMSGFLQNDIGVTLFDLALLGRTLVGKSVQPPDRIVPFTPLLSQGWSLLRANRVRMHPALEGLEYDVLDSLWSLYDESGWRKLLRALKTGEVR